MITSRKGTSKVCGESSDLQATDSGQRGAGWTGSPPSQLLTPGLTPLTQQGGDEGRKGEQKGFCYKSSSIFTEGIGRCLALLTLPGQSIVWLPSTLPLIFPAKISGGAKEGDPRAGSAECAGGSSDFTDSRTPSQVLPSNCLHRHQRGVPPDI